MARLRPKLGFPRKVVAYYLLFCMLAVTWLSVGGVWTSHKVVTSQTAEGCLARLDKIAASLEISYLRDGRESLQEIVADTKRQFGLNYCAIVSPDGTYLAHSESALVGAEAEELQGSVLQWGKLAGFRYVNERGNNQQEYQIPLVAQNERIGSLRIAILEPTLWQSLTNVAKFAPFTVLAPLVLVLLGGVVLSRMAKPMAAVEDQLRNLALAPLNSVLDLQHLPTRDPIALGWNRVVDQFSRLRASHGNSTLAERLDQAISSHKDSQFSEILQNLSEGIALTDMEGRILFANRAIGALLGDPAETDETIDKWLSHEDLQLKNREILDHEGAHRPAVSELERQTGMANRVIRVARQPVASEQLHGQLWCLRDITQQTLAEKMRDQFIDTATHELRTPLSNIKAYAETLVTCNTIDVEEQKEFCNTINSEVTRLARFVDDLLSISSMEVGSLTIVPQKVDTERMFAEVLEKVEPLMQNKEITFQKELPAKMRELLLDKDKIVAVLVNLLGNAAKYTPHGGTVAMKVKLDNTLLQVTIEDSGVGISAEELPKVFDKFFRSEDKRVQAETGTGLGLSLAQEIVRLHGGKISVDSELDKGSTFLVTLPVKEA